MDFGFRTQDRFLMPKDMIYQVHVLIFPQNTVNNAQIIRRCGSVVHLP
jgi:hypothetical protein